MKKFSMMIKYPGNICFHDYNELLINLIYNIYTNEEAATRFSELESEKVGVKNCLRQGCCLLSSDLFNDFAEMILKDILDVNKY